MSDPNRVSLARRLLLAARRFARQHGKRAPKVNAAIQDLKPGKHVAAPAPTPAPVPKPVRQKPFPAIEAARAQSKNGPQFLVGECMMRVRECYDIPSGGDFDGDGDADAEDGWKRAQVKHGPTAPVFPGNPVFWTGGSNDNGHVAIVALPNGFTAAMRRLFRMPAKAYVWSTDIRRPGFFDRVPLTEIHDKWGLTYVGTTEDLNGVRIEHGARAE